MNGEFAVRSRLKIEQINRSVRPLMAT